MGSFFKYDFGKNFDQITSRFERLKQALRSDKRINNSLRIHLEKNINEISACYRVLLMNASDYWHKKRLLAEYLMIINELERVLPKQDFQQFHAGFDRLIHTLKRNRQDSTNTEILARIGNAISSLYWLGVIYIALIALAFFVAVPVVTSAVIVALALISCALLIYSCIKFVENSYGIFGAKEYGSNYREKNNKVIACLERISELISEDAQAPFSEVSDLTDEYTSVNNYPLGLG